MKYFAAFSHGEVEIELLDSSGEVRSTHDKNKIRKAELKAVGNGVYLLLIDNKSYELFFAPTDPGYEVRINGFGYRFQLEDQRTRNIRRLRKVNPKNKDKLEVKSPMPGLIVDFHVQEGDLVKEGQGLVTIEAMKMENEIRSEVAGVVEKIFTRPKDSIEKDAILMVIKSSNSV
ncbi:MAG: acetyl-CoA carboxylase biotin carboxyl carrier protein subunit [bacterium]